MTLVVWSYLGFRAVVTGVLPTFAGRLRRRPVLHRVGGLAVLYAGWGVFATLMTAAQDRPRPAAGAEPPSADSAPADAAYERVAFGGGEEVLYTPGLRADAERLGAVLRDAGAFDGRSPKTFAVERAGGGWVVNVVTTDAARGNPGLSAFYRHSLGVRVAARAFPGESVEFRFCDPALAPHAAVALPAAGVVEVQGKDAVYYLGPIADEAGRVAAFLRPRLGPPGDRAFVLTRTDAGRALVPLNVTADALTPDAEKSLAAEAADLSRSAFGGGPVEVVVYDRSFQTKRAFRGPAAAAPAWAFDEYQRSQAERRSPPPINFDQYRESYQPFRGTAP